MLVSDSQSFPVRFGFPKSQNPSEFNFQRDGQVRSRFWFGEQCKIGNTKPFILFLKIDHFWHSFDTRNWVVRPTKEMANLSKFPRGGGGGKPPGGWFLFWWNSNLIFCMLPSCHNFSTDFGTVFVFASMEYWEYWGGNAVYLWALTSNWTPFEPIAYCDSEKHFWNLNCVRIYPGESVGWSVLSLVLSDFHCTISGSSNVLKSRFFWGGGGFFLGEMVKKVRLVQTENAEEGIFFLKGISNYFLFCKLEHW